MMFGSNLVGDGDLASWENIASISEFVMNWKIRIRIGIMLLCFQICGRNSVVTLSQMKFYCRREYFLQVLLSLNNIFFR